MDGPVAFEDVVETEELSETTLAGCCCYFAGSTCGDEHDLAFEELLLNDNDLAV